MTKIIHRDIKAANIFLDENFDAVVGDLKLAKFMDHFRMSVTTAVRGTIGHIAPEYIATGECSDKTDVYSYGVFLLELITGQSAFELLRLFKNDEVMLIDWVSLSSLDECCAKTSPFYTWRFSDLISGAKELRVEKLGRDG